MVAEAGLVSTLTDDLSVYISSQYINDIIDGSNNSQIIIEARQRINKSVDIRLSGEAE